MNGGDIRMQRNIYFSVPEVPFLFKPLYKIYNFLRYDGV